MRLGTMIICEGNIGAGKTEFAKEFSERYGLTLFREPVKENPYLEKYYQDPKRYALEMQLWLLQKRFKCHVEGIEELWRNMTENKPRGVIFDRSIYGDSTFELVNYDEGNIDEGGHEHYLAHRDTMFRYLMPPHYCIYLDVKPEICMYRIKELRKRECEQGITLEYLYKLQDYHFILLEKLAELGTKIIKIDWNEFKPISDTKVFEV